MKIKVFIVDDHPFTRVGVRSILESNNSIDIIGEAEDGLDAVKQVIEKRPDLVVMDINMPLLSGIEASKKILHEIPDIKIIALSIHKGEIYVKKMLDAGALGYLLKDEAPEELLRAIEKVNKGDIYLSSGVIRVALNKSKHLENESRSTLILSKLQKPLIAHDYLIRTKIILELEKNVINPLSLISAGAGYGKSVAVSQWLEQSQYPYSWISLDEEHNDLRNFLNYLVKAIEKVLPNILENNKDFITAPYLPPTKEIADTLINQLCDLKEDFIIVLDDYYKISETKIHELINELLLFASPHVHLCIITRRDPPLKINHLRLKSKVTEIRMNELSFSENEIDELFKQLKEIDLSKDALKLIFEKTEGWIIGLRLLSIVMKSETDLDRIFKSMDGGLNAVSDYLLNEVFSSLPLTIHEQLLNSSILNRFCSDLLSTISTKENKKQLNLNTKDDLIHQLLKLNLFVIPLDQNQKWYRYHHMFQDFLKSQLIKKKSKLEINELHSKSSHWFEDNELIEEAVMHAVKSEDENRAVEIISKNWEVVSDSDNFLLVDAWLNFLPNHLIESSISLLFARFFSVFKRHKLGELPIVLGLIQQLKAELSEREKGYLAFINAIINYYGGNGDIALKEAEKALKFIPEKFTSFRGDARTYWFISMLMNGEQDQALASHKAKIDHFLKLKEPVQLGRARTNIGSYALLNADLPLLKTATYEMSKTTDLSNFMKGFYLLHLQYKCWFNGDMEGVLVNSESVLKLRYEFVGRLVIDSFIMKALALQEINKTDLALSTMDNAIEFAEYTKDGSNLSVALSGKARLYLKQGEIKLANDWLDQTDTTNINSGMLWCVEVSEITRCRVLLANATDKDALTALELLMKYDQFAKSIFSKAQGISIMILQTIAYKILGKEKEAIKTLKASIKLASKGEWTRPFIEQYSEIIHLLELIKIEGIHSSFIDNLSKSVKKEVINDNNSQNEKRYLETSKGEISTAITSSELKVLLLIAEGLRNQEIADNLFNSEKTIKAHIYHMFQKLNVKNRLSLVSKAKEMGIIE